MHYKLYLHTLCQLSNKGLATLELDESIVFIEPIKEQRSIYPQLRKKNLLPIDSLQNSLKAEKIFLHKLLAVFLV